MMKTKDNQGRGMKISKIKIGKKSLLGLWMILCTLLMVPELILQTANRERGLETLTLVRPQEHLNLSQGSQKVQRAVTPVMEVGTWKGQGVPDQYGNGSDQSVTVTEVRATIGQTIQLPCQCTAGNTDRGKYRVTWQDNRGRVIDLLGESAFKKFGLINDKRRVKVKGDCNLYMRKVQIEDQGKFKCAFYNLQDDSENSEPRFVVRSVNLVILNKDKNRMLNNEWTTQPLQTTTMLPYESKLQEIGQITTVLMSKVQTMEGKENKNEPLIEQQNMSKVEKGLQKLDWVKDDQYHAMQKRSATWKAYGFDASMLQIKDVWAARNLWFQQVTHSVKSVSRLNCPCVVRVPAPGTWPSIMEAVPQPLTVICQSSALSWLVWKQQSENNVWMRMSSSLFKPKSNCTWITKLPYVNLLDQQENMLTAIPDSMEVTPVRAKGCFCSNNTYDGPGMFMGISDCDDYLMDLGNRRHMGSKDKYEATFQVPYQKERKTVMVKDQILPGNVTIGNFKDIWWVCGDRTYIFLPYGWTGCCYMATLKLPYEVFIVQKGEVPEKTNHTNVLSAKRKKREMAQFHNLESYHWRITLGEKWGIGLFPWYGVTFLADHIDNITYTLQGFANETIRGFSFLSDTQRSHRLTLLKHDMALDYVLAKQGGLCVALNLTDEACYTLIPDSSDNITSVIDALKTIRDAFGPSEGAGWSANDWLQDRLGPVGAVVAQIVMAALISLCVMFCFCTLLLTCAKAMILRWVGAVMPGDQVQLPLLQMTGTDADEELVIEVDKYPIA